MLAPQGGGTTESDHSHVSLRSARTEGPTVTRCFKFICELHASSKSKVNCVEALVSHVVGITRIGYQGVCIRSARTCTCVQGHVVSRDMITLNEQCSRTVTLTLTLTFKFVSHRPSQEAFWVSIGRVTSRDVLFRVEQSPTASSKFIVCFGVVRVRR